MQNKAGTAGYKLSKLKFGQSNNVNYLVNRERYANRRKMVYLPWPSVQLMYCFHLAGMKDGCGSVDMVTSGVQELMRAAS